MAEVAQRPGRGITVLDELLGYLLRAVDDDEHRRVAQRLDADREARRQLESLRLLLTPLEAFRVELEAPPGLAVRTCLLVLETSDVPPNAV
jgi:hypothetical protein